MWHWTAFTIHKQNDKKWRQKDSVKKWCEAKRNDVKQKEMMWNKKKWCETKRNDVKQKEMTRNKKKWRETKRNDEKQKEMTWSDSSWRFACGDVSISYILYDHNWYDNILQGIAMVQTQKLHGRMQTH